jgi:hypothetical protein
MTIKLAGTGTMIVSDNNSSSRDESVDLADWRPAQYVRMQANVFEQFSRLHKTIPQERWGQLFSTLADISEVFGADAIFEKFVHKETTAPTTNAALSSLASKTVRLVHKCGCINEAASLLDRLVDAVTFAGDHTDVIAKALDEAGRRARALRSYTQDLQEPEFSNDMRDPAANNQKKDAGHGLGTQPYNRPYGEKGKEA